MVSFPSARALDRIRVPGRRAPYLAVALIMTSGVLAPLSARTRGACRRLRRGPVVVAAALAVFAGTPEATAKERPWALRPSTRPFFALLGVGPTAGIGGQCYAGYYYGYSLYNEPGFQTLGCGGALKISQEIGFHFKGSGEGPAAGLLVQEELLSYGYFGLSVAPKFSWDIQLLKDVGFYVSPNVAVGYHRSRWFGHPTMRGGSVQGGVALKLSLGDRGLLYTQLPHFDFVFGPGYSMVRYDFIVGGGISF